MIRAAVIGGAGYTGGELLRLLLRHPQVELLGVFGSERRRHSDPEGVGDLHPPLRGRTTLAIEGLDFDELFALKLDLVVLATPPGVSHELAPKLVGQVPVVFDLSGAFRLDDPAAHERHYGHEHAHPELLARKVYGLAEVFASRIREADFVAVPGCYPTATILATRPLIKANVVDQAHGMIVDAISGVSGAGRAAGSRTSFCEVSVSPYNVLTHRHQPEIELYAGLPTVFTPHLGPFKRGILATIHLRLAAGQDGASAREVLRAAYAERPLVRVLAPGKWPAIGAVEHTPYCDLGLAADDERGHLVVVSAIDNLLKGAASQAVQCMNIRFGLPEEQGLS